MAEQKLPDHTRYDRETVEMLRRWAGDLSGVELLVCTQKDLVKLRTDRVAGLPLVALLIDAEVQSSEAFDRMIERVCQSAAATQSG